MDLGEKIKDKKIKGIVEEIIIGGPPITKGVVKGNTVYETVTGGPDRIIGYVKEGVAYETVLGGPDRIIGRVNYHKKE